MCLKPIGWLAALPVTPKLAVAHCSELWKATDHPTRKIADLTSVLLKYGKARRVGWLPKYVEENHLSSLEGECQSEGVFDQLCCIEPRIAGRVLSQPHHLRKPRTRTTLIADLKIFI